METVLAGARSLILLSEMMLLTLMVAVFPFTNPAFGNEEHPEESAESDRIIGDYKIGIGAARPDFEGDLKFYNELYGDERFYPMMNVEYFFLNGIFAPGIGFSGGYYSASGAASDKKDSVEKSALQDTQLVLIPLQVVGSLQITPWESRLVSFTGRFGLERIYVQETRTAAVSDENAATTAAGEGQLINSGWNMATVAGLAVSFRIDSWDPGTSRSLRSMGLRSVYITPFIDKIATSDAKMGYFGRDQIGLMFSFETL